MDKDAIIETINNELYYNKNRVYSVKKSIKNSKRNIDESSISVDSVEFNDLISEVENINNYKEELNKLGSLLNEAQMKDLSTQEIIQDQDTKIFMLENRLEEMTNIMEKLRKENID